MNLNDGRALTQDDFAAISEAIKPAVVAALKPFHGQILVAKKRERADLLSARQRRRPLTVARFQAQSHELASTYTVRTREESPAPRSWSAIADDYENLNARTLAAFDAMTLPDVERETYVRREKGERVSMLDLYQKRKADFMAPATSTRERAAKLAGDRVLQKRSKGESADFSIELDRATRELNAPPVATHYAKEKPITTTTPPKSLRARAAALAFDREMFLRRQGLPGDAGALVDDIYRELCEAEGRPLRYERKPPTNGMPAVYTPIILRAREIAARRCERKGDSTCMSGEIQKAVNELLEAASARMNGKAANVLYGDDEVEQHLLSSGIGALSDQASHEAMRRVLAKRARGESAEYKTELLEAMNEIRRRAFDDKSTTAA